ncbi:MAG TPA: TraX family protein [Lachnospiraceae bacterium]|nr:TraX family protein [Lachnospiraceae bacterium]
MEETNLKKGLTSYQLKYIALFLMVLDHIHYFFEFTGRIPIVFSMLGRLSAPLFLFCVVEGFIHTHNRKAYFLRIYIVTILMGLIEYALFQYGSRPDGFVPLNQIFANFTVLIVILQGLEWLRDRKWVKGVLAVVIPIALPYIVMYLMPYFPSIGYWIGILHFSILPMHTMITDGGTYFILQGIILYLLRRNRKLQVAGFVIAVILFDGIRAFLLIPDVTFVQMFTQHFEWMGAFSAIFMLKYNEQRGNGSKRLFYWFYPIHIYVLYALSYGVYLLMN